MRLLRFALVGCLALAGCASTPPVVMTYYFPKARSEVVVTQTVGCSMSNRVLTSATASVTNSYVPDYDTKSAHTIHFKNFDGAFRDADTGVVLLDDGRLSGINAAGTGEGDIALKNAVALAGVFTGVSSSGAAVSGAAKLTPSQLLIFKRYKLPLPPPTSTSDAFCDVVRGHAAAKKDDKVATVTLTYKARAEFIIGQDSQFTATVGGHPYKLSNEGSYAIANGQAAVKAPMTVEPEAASSELYSALQAAGRYRWSFTLEAVPTPMAPSQPSYTPPEGAPTPSDGAGTTIAVPALSGLHLSVLGPASTLGAAPPASLWQDDLVIPSRTPVWLPITKAALFGGTKTTMQASQSGLVTKLDYSKSSASGDVTGFASAIAAQAQGRTDSQLAAAVQGKADLVYQQQRLVTCQLDASACPPK